MLSLGNLGAFQDLRFPKNMFSIAQKPTVNVKHCKVPKLNSNRYMGPSEEIPDDRTAPPRDRISRYPIRQTRLKRGSFWHVFPHRAARYRTGDPSIP